MDRSANSSHSASDGRAAYLEPGRGRRADGILQQRRRQIAWPAEREFRILSIDGGGIRGILPVAILAELERRYLGGRAITGYFDLVAGTSTGGIIALGLGAGLTASQILEIYLRDGKEIFPPSMWGTGYLRMMRQIIFQKYGRQKLDAMLQKIFGIKRMKDSVCRLCIPAYEGKDSDIAVFKTPHHPDYTWDGEVPMAKVAAFTSAAPTFFRHKREGDWSLIDGGVWANDPAMVAVVEAMQAFDVDRHKIRVLSLGCLEDSFPLTVAHKWLGGILAWSKVIYAAMRLQSKAAQGQTGLLIGRERLLRLNKDNGYPRIDLDDYTRSMTELPAIARSMVDEFGERIMEQFLSTPSTENDRV